MGYSGATELEPLLGMVFRGY